MTTRLATKKLVVEYLLHLKAAQAVEDTDNLDVAIDCLRDCFGLPDVRHGSADLELILSGAKKPSLPSTSANELKEQGNAAFKAEDFREAIRFFTQAIEVSIAGNEPAEQRAVYFANRAAARLGLKIEEEATLAIKDCEESVRLCPSYHKAWFRLGNIHESTNNKPEAYRAYSQALTADPNNSKYREARDRVSEGRPEQAAPDLSALANNPLFAQLRDDPEVLALMQNPKVADLLSKAGSNPMAIMSAMSDPELAPIFQRLVQKLGPQLSSMLGGLGGLFGGGAGGSPPPGMYS
ncbi:Putative TPR repeat family protein [Giardia duodenalis]|uniref:Small glutamine-rich tetratricopeptide repeat-containing protein n=2 Tax=Giardia intestinalis TaxID=5741 RepID=C6LT41_GIAIB|nr:Small glutamine-rich tetratricopeptide repeat-containing protein [Giardia intestinalis ATCC 50581]ESU44763.1 Putative TPR repeat family protein [Giardia intestinalis]